MGKSRVGRPRCSKCLKEYRRQYYRDGIRKWENVKLLRVVDNLPDGNPSAILKCCNCGHEWVSRSKFIDRITNEL